MVRILILLLLFVEIAIPQHKRRSPAFADTFDRTTLSGNNLIANSFAIDGTPTIVSNELRADGADCTVAIYHLGRFTRAQSSKIVYTESGTNASGGGGPMILADASRSYMAACNDVEIALWRVDAGPSPVQLAIDTAIDPVNGDVIEIYCDASGNISVARNGTVVLTATDVTYTTGSPGVCVSTEGANYRGANDWVAINK